jgi:Asp-tRNA(Asn)/Glu-tRNA(Gln) amidotransferase A subunit family amidase
MVSLARDTSHLSIATLLYNVVDSTVGCLPVTRVDRSRDATPPVDEFLADSPGSFILEKRIYGVSDPAYDANKMHGLPVGIQVVGKAWEDEKVLSVMKEIQDAVQYE